MNRQCVVLSIGVILLLSIQAQGQERNADSVQLERIRLAEPGMDSGGALFLIPPHLQQQQMFSSPSFVFEGVSMFSGASHPGSSFQAKPDLLAPLRVQWAREAEMGTFRAILGTIQLGGVAFLAARQFTKAGVMTAKPRPVRSSRK